jgi:hypothetical protein
MSGSSTTPDGALKVVPADVAAGFVLMNVGAVMWGGHRVVFRRAPVKAELDARSRATYQAREMLATGLKHGRGIGRPICHVRSLTETRISFARYVTSAERVDPAQASSIAARIERPALPYGYGLA